MSKSAVALGDQVAFAAGNLLIGVLMARWLPSVSYGVFAFAYAVLGLAAIGLYSLFGEALLVFGPARFSHELDVYLGGVLLLQLALATGVSLTILTASTFAVASPGLPQALLGAAVSVPAVSTYWTLRRWPYVRQSAITALIASVMSASLLLVGLAILRLSNHASSWTAFVPLSISAAVGVGFLLYHSGVAMPNAEATKRVLQSHWLYGRWSLSAAGTEWLLFNAYVVGLPFVASLSLSATVRVATIIVLLPNQVFVGLAAPAVARMAQLNHGSTMQATLDYMNHVLKRFLGLALLFALAVEATGWLVLPAVFGSQYAELVDVLPIIAMCYLPIGVVAAYRAFLRATARSLEVFIAYAVGAATLVAVGFPLSNVFGVVGALTGLFVAITVTAILMWRLAVKIGHPSRMSVR